MQSILQLKHKLAWVSKQDMQLCSQKGKGGGGGGRAASSSNREKGKEQKYGVMTVPCGIILVQLACTDPCPGHCDESQTAWQLRHQRSCSSSAFQSVGKTG